MFHTDMRHLFQGSDMWAIIQPFIPLAVKIFLLAIEKNILSKDQAKAFYEFVKVLNTGGNSSKRYVDMFSKHERKLAEGRKEK